MSRYIDTIIAKILARMSVLKAIHLTESILRWFFRTGILLYFLALLSAIPIVLNNYVLSWRHGKTVGNLEDWMSFLGGYIGGIIGGMLTLVGVWLTIKRENKREFVKEYVRTRIILEEAHDDIKKVQNYVAGNSSSSVSSYKLQVGLERINEHIYKINTNLGGDLSVIVYRKQKQLRELLQSLLSWDSFDKNQQDGTFEAAAKLVSFIEGVVKDELEEINQRYYSKNMF